MITTTITQDGLWVRYWERGREFSQDVFFKSEDVFWSEALEKCLNQIKCFMLWQLITSSKHKDQFSIIPWHTSHELTIEICNWKTMITGSDFDKLSVMIQKNPHLFELVRAMDLSYDLPQGSTNG